MIFHSSPVQLLPGQSCHRIWTDTLLSPSSQIESERFLGWKGRRSYNYLYLYKYLYFRLKKMNYFSKSRGFPSSYRKVFIFLGFFGLEKMSGIFQTFSFTHSIFFYIPFNIFPVVCDQSIIGRWW